jgi:hypothetical protein
MEVLSIRSNYYPDDQALLLLRKMDSDEKTVRKTLVKVWTRILEKYARPGMQIPSVEAIRRELMKSGVDAAVNAVVDDHWVVFSFMIRERIQVNVERGLAKFDLEEFLMDVKTAQNDPQMLAHLRETIKRYVMEDF